jgi:hypothetical protein
VYLCAGRLNEGHTVFVERKIIGRMKGENFRQFEANGGWGELKTQVSFLQHFIHSHLTFPLTVVLSLCCFIISPSCIVLSMQHQLVESNLFIPSLMQVKVDNRVIREVYH